MAWDCGRYYTRSRKVNGRVVREYVGSGEVARLVAQQDLIEREKREAERVARRRERDELQALDAPVEEMDQTAALFARVALIVAGFHQHHRGEWRKKRGNRQPVE
jgi:hypothetical protein